MQFNSQRSVRVPWTEGDAHVWSNNSTSPPVVHYIHGRDERTIPFATSMMEYHSTISADAKEVPVRLEEEELEEEAPLFSSPFIVPLPNRFSSCSATIAAAAPIAPLVTETYRHCRRQIPIELWVGEVCSFLPFKASISLARVNRALLQILLGRRLLSTTPLQQSPLSPRTSFSSHPKTVRISYRKALFLEFGLTQLEWNELRVQPTLECTPQAQAASSFTQLVFKEKPTSSPQDPTLPQPSVSAESSLNGFRGADAYAEEEVKEKAQRTLRTLYQNYAFCLHQFSDQRSPSGSFTPVLGSPCKEGSWVAAVAAASGVTAAASQEPQPKLSWVKVRLSEVSIAKVTDIGRLCRALAHHAKWRRLCECQSPENNEGGSTGAAEAAGVTAATPLTPPPAAATLSQSPSSPKDPHELVLQSIVSVVERLQGVLARTAPAGERARYHRLLVQEQQRMLTPLPR